MKKLFIIPIMFIYLLAVSGIMINMHYCGMELESWNVYASEGNGCEGGECGDETEQNDDCCKDETIAAKVSEDQNVTSAFKLKMAPAGWVNAILPVRTLVPAPVFTAASRITVHQPNAPPGRWQSIPLYKLHSSFTYYG